MLEIKVSIEAPELAGAINNLATALTQANAPLPVAPVTKERVAEAVTPEMPLPMTFMPEDVEKVEEPVAEAPKEEPVNAPEPEPVAEAPKEEPVEEPTEESTEELVVTRGSLFERCKDLMQSKKMTSAALSGMLQKYKAASIPLLKEEYLVPFWKDLDAMGV